jgi:hypothetical protein
MPWLVKGITGDYGDGVDGAPSGIERAKMVVVVNPI